MADDPELLAELRAIAESEGVSLGALGGPAPGKRTKGKKKQTKKDQGALNNNLDLDAILKIGVIDENFDLDDDDLNDPALQAELKSLGVNLGAKEDKKRGRAPPSPGAPPTLARAGSSSASEVLRDLGLADLGALDRAAEVTEEDFHDPELQAELAAIGVGAAGGEGGEEEEEEEAAPSAEEEAAALRAQAMDKKRAALAAKRAGDQAGAVALLREAKGLEAQAATVGNLSAAQALAGHGKRSAATVSSAAGGGAEPAAVGREPIQQKARTAVEAPLQQSSPAPDSGPPALTRRPSAEEAHVRAAELKKEALRRKRAGDAAGAVAALREAKALAARADPAAAARGRLARAQSLRRQRSAGGAAAAAADDGRRPPPDRFAAFQNAAAEAYNMYLARAKGLVKEDRAAAVEATKKAKEMKEHLAKISLQRGLGGQPPESRWEMTTCTRTRRRDDLKDHQLEISILSVSADAGKQGRGTFVKYSVPMSKETAHEGFTPTLAHRGEDQKFDFHTTHEFNRRSRNTLFSITNRKASFEVWRKKRIGFLGSEFVGRCAVGMNALLTKCELGATEELLQENSRRRAGGTLEVRLALRRPLQVEEVAQVEEREFVVGPWPPPPPPGATAAAAAAAAAPAAAAAAAAAGRGASPAAPAAVAPAAELADPFAPALLVSNDVLDAEIEALQAQWAGKEMPVDALVRLTQLQGALGLLVGAVQQGDLSLDRYLDRLRDRVRRDKVLALALKQAGRTRDAAAVLRRLKTMQAEIAGAEAAADEEDEEEGA